MAGMSYGDKQSALQAAVVAQITKDAKKGDDTYCYVIDFDDDSAVYGCAAGQFQVDYTMDASGNVELEDPVPVRAVTKYVPTGDAKGRPPFETRSAGQTMPVVKVKNEPLTYHRHARYSYLQDLALRASGHDRDAIARLERHGVEMDVELAPIEAQRQREFQGASLEYRVNPNRTTGQGGYFAPPIWLNELFATAPRAERVLADLMPTFPLPAGVQSVNLPRLTTGTKTNATPDDSAVTDQDAVEAQVASPVVPIAGMGDVALQLLEQSPAGAHLDYVFFKDLQEDYDYQLGQQLYSGTGSGSTGVLGQFYGLLNLSGINAVTYTSASPLFSQSTTPANNMYYWFGQMSAQIGDNRKRRPECWLMTTSRWSWIATSVDNQGRPIVPPDLAPPRRDGDGGPQAVSSMLGWPVYVDDSIPTNLSDGKQDRVIACRPSDLILLEGAPHTQVALEPLSGTLQARLRLHRYVAAITGRYPTGISVISGTGMDVQSGF